MLLINCASLNLELFVRRSVCTPTSSTEVKTKILESSAQVLPCNKSEMIQNQVTKPVAVPKTTSLRDILNQVDHDIGIEDEKVQNLEEDDDDDDGDAFSDAVETLSSTESICVSGLDNLDANKCRTSSSDDKQAQDFMMNRFLPAAKAMTLQPHQHAPRKQSVLLEQPSTKLVSEEKKLSVNKMLITDIIPYSGQYEEDESESEEEKSDHETDDYANISAKGCGLFPSSCIKNSLCLLNPMSETKTDSQIPLWSSYEIEKPNKSSHFSSSRSGPTIKKAWDAIHKSKSSSGASESKRYNTYSGEPNQISRLASFRRSGAAGVSSFESNSQSMAENNQSKRWKIPSQGHGSFQEVQSHGSRRSSNSRIKARRLITDQENNQESMSLQLVQSSLDKDTEINNKQIVVVDDSEKTDPKCLMHLLSPPLPKSPSESWLCRALPLVSFKNSLAYSSRGTQQSHTAKMTGYSRASSFSKWETIVKTSNLHHDHECCSQELTIYKSQHSKS
ncbi:uncharacterized protein LOC131607901 [Vicia villosa]|uniref:uncharacterized protein LOC131607901 n=1 Tax=Vicia villosa TaxID=3911 RepID=UPI00273BFFEB|nr:uncharacterized protein LOC131607901 [Vicia villosa]